MHCIFIIIFVSLTSSDLGEPSPSPQPAPPLRSRTLSLSSEVVRLIGRPQRPPLGICLIVSFCCHLTYNTRHPPPSAISARSEGLMTVGRVFAPPTPALAPWILSGCT